MARNTERTAIIRESTYGRETRTPIADSIQTTVNDTDALLAEESSIATWLVSHTGVKKIRGTEEDYVLCLAGGYNPAWDVFKDGYGKGNIDLNHRQVVHNPDGSISTERSFSAGFEKSELTGVVSSTELNKFSVDVIEVLLPTVINGQIQDEDSAIDYFFDHGQYLGLFASADEAESYAEMLHERQEWYYQ